MRFSPNRADFLLLRLLNGETEAQLQMDLLAELHDGYPAERLRSAIASSEPEVVRAAVWLASELAGDSRVLWDVIVPLFSAP